MGDWIETLLACRGRTEDAVLVSVAAARGSVPREPGTRMVVTALQQHGTIGGGHLELEAVGIARAMLAGGSGSSLGSGGGGGSGGSVGADAGVGGSVGALRRFPLGAALGQCCGGVVDLMFEKIPPAGPAVHWLEEIADCRARGEHCLLVSAAGHPDAPGALVVTKDRCSGSLGDERDARARALAGELLASGAGASLVSLDGSAPFFLFDPLRQPALDIVLFGAGHVGQALAKLLADLPCRVAWVDERAELFPVRVGGNIRVEVSDTPVAEVAAARPGACFLVMTHSHPLDEALAEAILRRGDFRYFGLIGSLSKRSRFERRLAARGIAPEALTRMTCPIGIEGVDGKSPPVIAVAVAAELLRMQDRQDASPGG